MGVLGIRKTQCVLSDGKLRCKLSGLEFRSEFRWRAGGSRVQGRDRTCGSEHAALALSVGLEGVID